MRSSSDRFALPHLDRRATLRLLAIGALAPGPAGAEGRDMRDIRALLEFLDRDTLNSGGAHERALGDLMAGELVHAGFSVNRQPLDVPWFEAERAEVHFGGAVTPLVPQMPVIVTEATGIAAPLSYLHPGDAVAAVRGTITVLHLPKARHSQLIVPGIRLPVERIVAAGARAVILITDGPTGETIYLNSPFARPITPVPIAVIGPKPGEPLIEAARAGSTATIIIRGEAGHRPSSNVIGRLSRGPGPWMIVSTPRTGWTRAVAERGPGIAIWKALARWAPRALPRQNLLFIATTAHEFDNEGGKRFLGAADTPPPREVMLWVHLGAGLAGRAHHEVGGYRLAPLPSPDPARYMMGSPELIGPLRRAFAGQPGLEAPYPAGPEAAGELSEIIAAGYAPVMGAFGAHIRHHVMSDRIDATDPVWIAEAVAGFRTAIGAFMRRR